MSLLMSHLSSGVCFLHRETGQKGDSGSYSVCLHVSLSFAHSLSFSLQVFFSRNACVSFSKSTISSLQLFFKELMDMDTFLSLSLVAIATQVFSSLSLFLSPGWQGHGDMLWWWSFETYESSLIKLLVTLKMTFVYLNHFEHLFFSCRPEDTSTGSMDKCHTMDQSSSEVSIINQSTISVSNGH